MDQRTRVICFALLATTFGAGCNKTSAPVGASDSASAVPAQTPAPQSDREAIATAIQQHLTENKGINMSAMTMNISTVTVNGDQAQADAEFLLKQGGTSMLITYYLERHGGGWIVVRNQPRGDSQFAHPPMDQVRSGTATAAPGATPGSASNALPDVSSFFKNRTPTKSN